MNETCIWGVILLINGLLAWCMGYHSGKASADAPPSEEAWIEVKKYELDKQWEYIKEKNGEEIDE